MEFGEPEKWEYYPLMEFMLKDPQELTQFLELGVDSWERSATWGPSTYEAHALVMSHDTDGTMDSELAALKRLVEVLRGHTSSPNAAYFCFWDGWGFELDAPKLESVARGYYVTSGPLNGLDGWPNSASTGDVSPAFVWPEDRSWVIAKDVDAEAIGLAASRSAIAAVSSEREFEVRKYCS